MRWLLILICPIASASFVGGCSSRQEIVSHSTSANAKEKAGNVSEVSGPIAKANQAIVFRAKYYKTTGPCIQFGDAIGMPIIDAFKVVDVLKGNLKATSINVRAMSEGGSSYPKNLAEGTIYTLRLTPSATTTNQLQENEKEEGATFFWINGNEIEEFQAAK